MKKYLLFIAVIAMVVTSCENVDKSKETKENTKAVVVDEITPLLVAEFDEQAGNYVGKKIKMKGTVDHICKHGGQRLFLVSEDSEARIKITPDEEIAAFNAELEGNKLVLVGIVEEQRIDEDYLENGKRKLNRVVIWLTIKVKDHILVVLLKKVVKVLIWLRRWKR